MSPRVIHYHKDYSSLILLFICKFPLYQWETWFPPMTTHLIVQIQYSYTVVSELLTYILMEHNFINYRVYVQFPYL